jgi:hypothetical protein
MQARAFLLVAALFVVLATGVVIAAAPSAKATIEQTNVQPFTEIGPFSGGSVTMTAWQLNAKQIQVKVRVEVISSQATDFDLHVYVCAQPGGRDCNSGGVWRPFTLPIGDHSHTYQALFTAHTLNLYAVSYEVYDEDTSYPSLANYSVFFPGAL